VEKLKTNKKLHLEKQVRKNQRPSSGKIITLGKTGSKEPTTIKWKNNYTWKNRFETTNH